VAVNDVWKVSFWCSQGAQVSVNVRYWQIISQMGAPPTAATVAGYFDTLFVDAYRAVLTAQAQFYGVHAMHWRPEPPQAGAIAALAGRVGLITGISVPMQVSGLISLKTQLATRRGRGRIYIPFLSVTSLTGSGNALQSYIDGLTVLKDLFTTDRVMVGGGNDVTWRPVLFGRARDAIGSRPPLPEIFVEVTSGKVGGKLATQRRRGAYGRTNVLPA
jgi:hypothetical protein